MRLIDADELERMCENPEYTLYNGNMLAEWMKHCIVTAPTIEAEPVRHGWWVEEETVVIDGYVGKQRCHPRCSECYFHARLDGAEEPDKTRYCPNCGVKMDGKEVTGS